MTGGSAFCTACIDRTSAKQGVGDGSQRWELPRHEFTSFAPRASPYAVLIPVWNEGERLRSQLRAMAPYRSVCDIFVADASSTDGSTAPEVLRSGGVRALVTVQDRGVGAALRPALAHAILDGYEGVIFMDGNGKDDPEMLPRFSAALERGIDYAQGSRYIAGGQGVDTPITRDLLIRLVHSPLFSLACGRRFTDSTVGSRAFSRRMLIDPRVRPFRRDFRYYEIYFYLGWIACRLGYRVADVPVTRIYPKRGPIPTKISLRRGYWQMFSPLLMLLLRRY